MEIRYQYLQKREIKNTVATTWERMYQLPRLLGKATKTSWFKTFYLLIHLDEDMHQENYYHQTIYQHPQQFRP